MPFQITLKTTTTAIALALAAAPMAALTAQPAVAQTDQSDQSDQAEQPDLADPSEQVAQDYSAQELDAFTTALIEVSNVREKYNPLLQTAETEEQQAAIIEEANAEMTEVIESTEGMTMDDYLEIAQAASQDQALNERIVAQLQAKDQPTQ